MKPAVAIVTGGSRGIGAAIVRRLALTGLQVLLVYGHNEREALETARKYGSDSATVSAYRCDITHPDAAGDIFRRAGSMGDPVTLVNNAGITGRIGTLQDATAREIHRVIDVNLTATIMLCREAVVHWSRQGGTSPRSIVNISSLAARTGAPGEYLWYAAAKAGVNALTTGLAVEAAPLGIRVNAVSPGTTATTIHARAGRPDRAAQVGARSPMGRPATAEEVAAAVQWLVGPEASYVNGTILDVTGGSR